jgi:hypothetical protein
MVVNLPPVRGHVGARFRAHVLIVIRMGSKMQDSVSKAERYRKEAIKYGELSKSAQPAYLGDVYRKVAVRYAFMAEDLLRRSEHRRGPDL